MKLRGSEPTRTAQPYAARAECYSARGSPCVRAGTYAHFLAVSAVDRPEAVLGVNVAAGVAYLALVERLATLKLDGTAKLPTPTNPDAWEQLRLFGDRLVAEARAHHVVCVVFAEPRKYNAWKYYEAFSRASLQVAGSLALHAARVEVLEVAQRTAATTLGLKLGELDDGLAETLGIDADAVVHWKHRVPAVAVAVHAARERWS
jgi:hypothetical protein